MRRFSPFCFFTLALTLTLSLSASAQLDPQKALASMKTSDGVQVELFAAEPTVLNPTSIDVDPLGRVWVCEAVNYRRKGFGRPILRPEGDRIVILTDTNGDGKAEESTVFYQGEDLYGPLGIAVVPLASGERKLPDSGQQGANAPRSPGRLPCKVFVCQSPDILLFHDKDGDGKADGPPEKFLTGFRGFDHDHGVHGINIGPDGKLYFTVGDSGVGGLQSKDGKGPKFTSNDTTVQKGTVWRCDMDGNNLELIAHNFRNNYEACVNSFGEVWLSDNDDDGNQQTRICFVMPGGNYGYGPRGKGQTHWHEEQPGIVHKTLRTGFGSPTGICFYEGTQFGKAYQGQLLHTDAGPREVRCFHIKPKGAGYELDKEVMLTSSDSWFRPSDVCVAPDGSIIVADWYDPGVGGHGMGDWTRGRIYRLTPKGHTGYKIPPVKLDTKEGFAQAIGSPCLATRWMATAKMQKLVQTIGMAMKAKKENAPEIAAGRNAMDELKLIGDLSEDVAVQLLVRYQWAMLLPNESRWNPTPMFRAVTAIADVCEEKGEKRFALPMLLRADRDICGNELFKLTPEMLFDLNSKKSPVEALTARGKEFVDLFGPTPVAQRELLITLRTLDPALAKPIFYILAKKYDGQDIFYRAALNIACGTDPERRDKILADFDKHFPEWNDTVADLVWELRPKSVLPRLEKLLVDAKLTDAQKARVVDILAANDDPAAGLAMLKLLTSEAPAEVKSRALENLRLFLPTKWNALAKGDDLKFVIAQLLGEAKTRITGLHLIAASNFAGAVDDVEKIGADTNEANDTRLEAVRTLGAMPTAKAVDALMRIGQPQNALSVAVVKALGQHLPTGGGKPSEANTRAMDALQLAVTLPKASAELKQAALEALTGSRTGTDWLLALKEKNEMPAELVADAGRLLRNSPFQGQRNKAMLLFPAPGKLDPKKLPPPSELAKRLGNAVNGQKVMARSFSNEVQCLKCHMVRGQGGQIGPDLSMIGKKGSKEDLFNSILQPSKAIADQFVSWKIDTADGQTITGLIVGETPKTVTVRDANGKDYAIPTADIDKRSKSLVSLMPDNLVAGLTEEELIDMVAYLATLQTPSLTPDAWHLAGPFPAENMTAALGKEYGPEKGPFDPQATFPLNGKSTGWRTIRPAAGGYLDLAAFHGNAGANSATYLFREVESPEAQEATVLLGTDDGAKLWVNGEEVFKTEASRAAAPEQDTVKVKLKKGPNAILLKVANGNNPHGAYVTILSAQELKLGK